MCVVNEPYEPPAVAEDRGSDKEEEGILSLGFRIGFNFSQLYSIYQDHYRSYKGYYNPATGFQAGLVFDVAVSELFHVQPGLMYIQKGAEDNGTAMTSHYIQIPLLVSVKLSAFRVNAGQYFGISVGGKEDFLENDFGLSAGFGFDVGMFYIGMFYDYGLIPIDTKRDFDLYNRTYGLNFGVNL